MGGDPDCVDRTVPEGGDDYPVGTLPSEPLCVITDDRTYQEKIEALSGTIYDYDDVCDNRPDYFDYDDPYDYEEYGCDGPVEGEMCYDPCRSDVAGGRTVFSRACAGDRSTGVMSAPKPTAAEVGDRPSSIGPDRTDDSTDKTIPFPCVMNALIPDDTEVSDRSPSETPYLAGVLGRKTESSLSGFGKPSTGDGTIFHRARVDDQSVGAVPVPKPTATEDRDRSLSSDS